MNKLQISLLGYFQVLLNGELIADFATDSVRALLAYLALKPRQLHERERLAELLWAEEPREKSLTNLRTTLSRLRTALKDEEELSGTLLVTRQSIGLQPTVNVWVDLVEIQRLASSIRSHDHYHVTRCPHCVEQMTQLVELYQGSVLAGLRINSSEFDNWQRQLQEEMHDILMEVLDALTTFFLQRHEFAQAIRYARRHLALEAWDERAHRHLMAALHGNGQRSAALSQYKRCVTILQAEFGAPPSDATQALVDAIRRDLRPHIAPLPGLETILPVTPLYGRWRELEWLVKRLASPTDRLVTLVGMGGIGKTALAKAAAYALRGCFADGVWFIPLVGVEANSDAALVTEAIAGEIAEKLALPTADNGLRSEQLLASLAQRSLLLVLDNAEHLRNGVLFLSQMLKAAPHLSLLVTSRLALELANESVYPLQGLPYPGSRFTAPNIQTAPAKQEAEAALTLFAEAARRVQPNFILEEHYTEVVQICQRVEGLPLALEMAAVHINHLPLSVLAQGMNAYLDTEGRAGRAATAHQTNFYLIFDSSWQLLGADERKIFAQLALFSGGISLVAAQAVAAATTEQLNTLVDHMFLQLDRAQERYQIHPLLQQYGLEKLRAQEALLVETQNRHARYFCQWLNSLQAQLKGATAQATLKTIGAELSNLRAAWLWAADQGNPDWLDQAMEGIFGFYLRLHRYPEGAELCQESLHLLTASLRADTQRRDQVAVYAMVLVWHGRFLQILGKLQEARQQNEEARQLMGDTSSGKQEECTPDDVVFAAILAQRGHLLIDSAPAEAETFYRQALMRYRKCQDHWNEANMLAALARCAEIGGDFDQAERLDAEALALRINLGDPTAIALSRLDLGLVTMQRQRLDEAEEMFQSARKLYAEAKDAFGYARATGMLGILFGHKERHSEAIQALLECIREMERLNRATERSEFLNDLATLYHKWGERTQALLYAKQAWLVAQEVQFQPSLERSEQILAALAEEQATA